MGSVPEVGGGLGAAAVGGSALPGHAQPRRASLRALPGRLEFSRPQKQRMPLCNSHLPTQKASPLALGHEAEIWTPSLLKCHHLNFRGRWVPGMTTGVSEGRCQVAGSIGGLPPDVSRQLGHTGPSRPRVWLLSRSAPADHSLSSPHPVGGAFLPLLFGHRGVDFLTEGCFSHCPILPSLIFPVHPVKAFPGAEQETQAGPSASGDRLVSASLGFSPQRKQT